MGIWKGRISITTMLEEKEKLQIYDCWLRKIWRILLKYEQLQVISDELQVFNPVNSLSISQ